MPRRWPTVKRCTPSCAPSTRPSSSTISPARAAGARAGHERRRSRRRGRSRSPATRACRSWAGRGARACARTSSLVMPPSGKRTRGERLGRHVEQEVRLILAAIARARQAQDAVAAALDARVVAGGERVAAERARPRQQRRELDVLVAAHARVGRAAGRVLGDEVVDDARAELVLVVARRRTGCRGARRRGARPRCRAGRSSGRPLAVVPRAS